MDQTTMSYSAYREDEIAYEILSQVSDCPRSVVDCGAADGLMKSNSRLFVEKGWDAWLIDGDQNRVEQLKVNCESFPKTRVISRFVSCEPGESLDDILDEHDCPNKIGLLSIDIDSNDYWVWKSLRREPCIIIIEFNGNFLPSESLVLKYEPTPILPEEQKYKVNGRYSASPKALINLSEQNGYTYIGYTRENMIFALFIIAHAQGLSCNELPPTERTHCKDEDWPQIKEEFFENDD